ncbi:MAG: NAD-dependent epimerase/dehydratase family protein, partial [Chitinivibrionales bacterium]|nr:NAD-dependent epimerase/dehydratase family protein [Chitinivibrionales bacterium]MBD3395994.1 NAD-dependent epimerase/dehydratase family protein [Chitinivibrionales bacterium]
MSPSAWLVTGTTGFIGGFLTAALLKRGEHVIAAVRPARDRTPAQRM